MKKPAFLQDYQYDDQGKLVYVSVGARVRRILTALLVILLNVFLILRATVSCDVALQDTILLSPLGGRNLAAAALSLAPQNGFSSFSTYHERGEGATLWHLYPSSGMDEMGHVQITDVDYVDGAGILQFSVKQNLRHYPAKNEAGSPTLSFVVRVIDAEGKEHFSNTAIAHTETYERRGYLYTRVAFDDLDIKLGEEYVTLYVFLTGTSDTLFSITLHGQNSASSRDSLSSRTYLAVS